MCPPCGPEMLEESFGSGSAVVKTVGPADLTPPAPTLCPSCVPSRAARSSACPMLESSCSNL